MINRILSIVMRLFPIIGCAYLLFLGMMIKLYGFSFGVTLMSLMPLTVGIIASVITLKCTTDPRAMKYFIYGNLMFLFATPMIKVVQDQITNLNTQLKSHLSVDRGWNIFEGGFYRDTVLNKLQTDTNISQVVWNYTYLGFHVTESVMYSAGLLIVMVVFTRLRKLDLLIFTSVQSTKKFVQLGVCLGLGHSVSVLTHKLFYTLSNLSDEFNDVQLPLTKASYFKALLTTGTLHAFMDPISGALAAHMSLKFKYGRPIGLGRTSWVFMGLIKPAFGSVIVPRLLSAITAHKLFRIKNFEYLLNAPALCLGICLLVYSRIFNDLEYYQIMDIDRNQLIKELNAKAIDDQADAEADASVTAVIDDDKSSDGYQTESDDAAPQGCAIGKGCT